MADLEDVRRLSPGRVSEAELQRAAREVEAAQSAYRGAYDHYREELAAYGQAGARANDVRPLRDRAARSRSEVAVSSRSVKNEEPRLRSLACPRHQPDTAAL